FVVRAGANHARPRGCSRANSAEHLFASADVHTLRWLVEPNQPRPHLQPFGEYNLLLVSAAERAQIERWIPRPDVEPFRERLGIPLERRIANRPLASNLPEHGQADVVQHRDRTYCSGILTICRNQNATRIDRFPRCHLRQRKCLTIDAQLPGGCARRAVCQIAYFVVPGPDQASQSYDFTLAKGE